MKDWHKKPPRSVRSVQDALKDAERLRREMPHVVQVRAYDWDKVILADEIHRLLTKIDELQEEVEDLGYQLADEPK